MTISGTPTSLFHTSDVPPPPPPATGGGVTVSGHVSGHVTGPSSNHHRGRCQHQTPKKRKRGTQEHGTEMEHGTGLNEMNMLSQVNMSGLRAATDENREKSRRFLWVFLLTVCFAVMVVSFSSKFFGVCDQIFEFGKIWLNS